FVSEGGHIHDPIARLCRTSGRDLHLLSAGLAGRLQGCLGGHLAPPARQPAPPLQFGRNHAAPGRAPCQTVADCNALHRLLLHRVQRAKPFVPRLSVPRSSSAATCPQPGGSMWRASSSKRAAAPLCPDRTAIGSGIVGSSAIWTRPAIPFWWPSSAKRSPATWSEAWKIPPRNRGSATLATIARTLPPIAVGSRRTCILILPRPIAAAASAER